MPDPARPLGGRPYLLAVGNAYWHKNRTFALRLVGWLVERQGWDGGLVLAGGHPDVGSSLEAEGRLLHASPVLADRVRDLGHISDEERLALLSGAELTLFPSYYEGFGFVPFESAALGTACVYTYGSSMRELLPPSGGHPVLRPRGGGPVRGGPPRASEPSREIVVAINEAAASLTWDRAAAGYLDVYERALSREPRPVSRRLLELVPGRRGPASDSEILLVDVYRRRRGFRFAANAAVGAGQAAVGVPKRAPSGQRQ